MRNDISKRLFVWLLVVDSVLWVSVTLVGQWITLGFDPIFYNPVFIAGLAMVFMLITSYLPFFVLYRFAFEAIVKRTERIRPSTLCWLLFVALLVFGLTVEVLSFGRDLNPVEISVPVALSIVNVAVFFQIRVRSRTQHRQVE